MIRALYQCLYRLWNLKDGENPDDKRILLCAYMGFAAFNISGQTISSTFHQKMYQKGTNHLSADELNTFRIKYRHLKLVIIDEISMVGNRTLNFINIRLQQLMGTKEVFGGLSVIAVGDLYQLKPVGDYLISLDLKAGASSLGQNLWKELFTMYELVDIMRQKDDLAFAQLLKGTIRQRSGKGAIRKRFPLQKPRWEKTKPTIRYLYHETYRKPNEQLFSQ